MKKKTLVILLITLMAVPAAACGLPFLGQTEAPPVMTEEVSPATEPPSEAAAEAELIEATEAPMETEADTPASSGTTRVYSDNGVSITLPESYVLGDVETDLEILVEGLQALGEEEAQDIEALYETYQDDILLWGFDTESPLNHQTSLIVMKNEEFAGMSLAMIMSFANVLLGDEVSSMQQEMLTLDGRKTARFLTSAENAGVTTAQAIYLFNEADKLWVVGFFTTQEQLQQRLSVFDQAVGSFSYQPAE